MEKVALIKSQPVSIPHQLKGSFPGVSPVKKITELLCCILELFGF
jgi:hypothetical protein